MADPITVFGAVASAVQLADVAFRVVSRIQEYCKPTNDVPLSLQQLSIQLPLLVELCNRYQDLQTTADKSKIDAILDQCIVQVRGLEALIDKVLPSDNDTLGRKTWKAIGSVRIERKVAEYQKMLETYKTLLSLSLNVLTFNVVQSGDSATTSRDTLYYFPTPESGKFIGRTALLDSIRECIKFGAQDPRVVVLVGLGGQGKTSVALEFCRKERIIGYFKAILWISTFSTATVQRSFAAIADHMTQHKRSFPTIQSCIDFVKETLERWGSPWLIVFDNYDRVEQVKRIMSFTPKARNGSVLFTSRHRDCGFLGTLIPVDGMDEFESVAFLLDRTGMAPSMEIVKQAQVVVQTLGYLPLAIDQCAAYIRSRKISLLAFVEHYQKRKAKVLQHTPALWDYQRVLDESEHETPLSVFTTWELSYVQVRDSGDKAESITRFLTVLGFFNNLEIRMEMFKAYFDHMKGKVGWMDIFSEDSRWDEFEYQDVVASLSQLSLIQNHETSHSPGSESDKSFCSVSLHPLVKDWIQLRLPPEDRQSRFLEAFHILEAFIDTGGNEGENFHLQTRRSILSHLDSILEYQQQTNPKRWMQVLCSNMRGAVVKFCLFYMRDARFQEAEDLCQRLLQVDRKESGAGSSEATESELYLTDIYLHQGRYTEVVKTLLKSKGRTMLSVVLKVHHSKNLARSYYNLGQYKDAIELYQSALEEQDGFLEENDFQRLDTLASMAQVFRNQGDHDKAVTLYNQVLEGYRTTDKIDHPRALHCMVDLANSYRAQALWVKARDLYITALAGNERKLGIDHPSTIATKLFLAITYRGMALYTKAEETFREIMEQCERVHGALHPQTLKAILNVGVVFDRQGRLEEAGKLYNAAFLGREKTLGLDNPYTLRTAERLINVWMCQDNFKDADKLARRVLSSLTNSDDMKELKDRKYPYVERLFRMAMTRDERIMDSLHDDRIETQKSLALILAKHGLKEESDEITKSIEASMDKKHIIEKEIEDPVLSHGMTSMGLG
jgi:tetratricopeptide (TPR) repeat protein